MNGGRSPRRGGGIRLTNASLEIRQCHVTICNAVLGGGLYLRESSTCAVSGSLLDHNRAALTTPGSGNGAALLAALGSQATFDGCSFRGNHAEGAGGVAMHSSDSLVSYYTCEMRDNSADILGGVVYKQTGATASFSDCQIISNSAGSPQGGVFYGRDVWSFHNCLIRGNSSELGSVAVFPGTAFAELRHCTVVSNNAPDGCMDTEGTVTISDTVMWNNAGDELLGTGVFDVTYSNIEGGWPGDGNIDSDPLFAAGPAGCYYLGQTAAGLLFDSPCVDAGSDTAANLGLDALTTRRDEVSDAGIVDMGYHYPVTGVAYIPGDIDRDGDRDLDDFEFFASAMTGPGPFPAGTVTGCVSAGDMDDDGDLDLADFAEFQRLFTGTGP